jgi:glycosyltransferase involved in cell wall biosynthesis
MVSLLKIGLVVDGTDHFLRPIEHALYESHAVERFSPRFVRLPLIGKRVNDWRLVNQLRHFTNRKDVVFLEWASELTALASRVSIDSKNVLRVHRAELFGEHLESFNWNAIDKIILVSHAMRDRFLQKFPALSAKAIVIYNGVNLQRFVVRESSFSWRIGMLGNLIPRKRAYEVICALADLDPAIPWSLEIGGAPSNTNLDYWDALQSLVSALRLEGRVRFWGLVEDPASWMQSIDVFISASYSEGHQVALIEAMASGCYCLSHCWDGAEEVLPPENIFTTDGDLRAKLLAYAALSETEKQQAQTPMRTVAEEKFDERRMVREIIEVIERTA